VIDSARVVKSKMATRRRRAHRAVDDEVSVATEEQTEATSEAAVPQQRQSNRRSKSVDTPTRVRAEEISSSPETSDNERIGAAVTGKRNFRGYPGGSLVLPSFSGIGSSLATHLAKWENCAEFYGWNSKQRLCMLRGSLDGPAVNILCELKPGHTEEDLVRLLKERFCDEGLVETFRAQLRSRRRRKGESLQSLYHDVIRLLNLSYPDDRGQYSQILGRDAFLSALDDDMRFRILDRGAQSLKEAFEIATRFESLFGACDGMPRDKSVRQVEKSAIDEWRAEMNNNLQRMETGFKAEMAKMEGTLNQRLLAIENLYADRVTSLQPMIVRPTRDTGESQGGDQLPVISDGNQRQYTGNRGKVQCYNCGKIGHIQKNCRNKQQQSNFSSSSATGTSGQFARKQNAVQTSSDEVEDQNFVETCLEVRFQKGSGFVNHRAILDSGAHENLIPKKYVTKKIWPVSRRLICANGSTLRNLGECVIDLEICPGCVVKTRFCVTDQCDEILLSRSWLSSNGFVWDFKDKIYYGDKCILLKPRNVSENVRRVYARESVCIPARSVGFIPATVAVTTMRDESCDYEVKPCAIENQAVLARSLVSNEPEASLLSINVSDADVLIRRGQFLSNACAVDREMVRRVEQVHAEVRNDTSHSTIEKFPFVESCGTETPVSDVELELIEAIISKMPDIWSCSEKDSVRQLLLRYRGLLAKDEYDYGKCTLGKAKLTLKDEKCEPVSQPLRNHALTYLDKIDQEVETLLQRGYVRPIICEWGQNIVVVPRKSIDGKVSAIRLTLDARETNEKLVRQIFPMPRSDMVFQCMRKGRLYSAIDLRNAYQSVELEEDSQKYTAFQTRRGLFAFRRLCPGLHASGSWFSYQILGRLFRDLAWDQIAIFIDDICFAFSTFQEGCKLLETVFSRLAYAGLKINARKCALFQTRIKVLGFIISENSIEQDSERIAVIKDIKFPRNARQLRGFLGFANYARAHYANFSQYASVMSSMLRKGQRVQKTPEAEACFEKLKQMMSEAPALKIFDPQAPITRLECDANGTNYASVLYQGGEDGKLYIVAYHSGKFTEAELKRCITFKELAAIVKSLKHFRAWLLGKDVIIKSDHRALSFLYTSRTLLPQAERFLEFLTQFQIKLEYQKGSTMYISDYLSRLGENDVENPGCRPCESSGILCRSCRAPEEIRGQKRAVLRDDRKCVNRFGVANKRVCCSDMCKNSNTRQRAEENGCKSYTGILPYTPTNDATAVDGRNIGELRPRDRDSASSETRSEHANSDVQSDTVRGSGLESADYISETQGPGEQTSAQGNAEELIGEVAIAQTQAGVRRPRAQTGGDTARQATADENGAISGGHGRAAGRLSCGSDAATEPRDSLVGSDEVGGAARRERAGESAERLHWGSLSLTTTSRVAMGERRDHEKGAIVCKAAADCCGTRGAMGNNGAAEPIAGGSGDGQDRRESASGQLTVENSDARRATERRENDGQAASAIATNEKQRASGDRLTVQCCDRVSTRANAGQDCEYKPSGTRSQQLKYERATGEHPLMVPECLNLSEIKKAVENDRCLSQILKAVQSKQIPDELRHSACRETQCYLKQIDVIEEEGGVLYRKFFDVNLKVKYRQVILPEVLKDRAMVFVHQNLLGHARSTRRVEQMFSRYFFCFQWKLHLRVMLQSCRTCLEFHKGRLPKNAYLKTRANIASRPGECAQLDLIGPLCSSQGKVYCLTFQDSFSRFLILKALRGKTAAEVAEKIVDIFQAHGFYQKIHADNGPEFTADVYKELMKITGTRTSYSFAYMPRQNGVVERSHRTMHAILAKSLRNHRDWVKMLPHIASVFNSMEHSATGFSPSHLHFGRNINLSLDAVLANRELENWDNYGSFARDLLRRTQEAYDIASSISKKRAEIAVKSYNSKIRPKEFSIGDKVLTFDPRVRKGEYYKWKKPFSVGATIIGRINEATVLIEIDKTKKRRITHVDKLKMLQKADGSMTSNPTAVVASG
jgi:transposase InsO family protein